MCGICGVMSLDGMLDPAIRDALPAMTLALRHRGPDDQGLFADSYAALGHRRLAIIDRVTGSQPMPNEDGSCWVVFNGEIYNHQSLRQQLIARGHRFRTLSDTETIVHAYEEYGTSCPERLEGMFAFAVYDQRRRALFLARDRIGKKPLFYASLGQAFHFASEIKALACSPTWNGEMDLTHLEGYLSLGYFPAPSTVYRHVRKLEPGHWLRVKDGRLDVRQYWDIERFDDDRREATSIVAELESTLRQAVGDRLESEVPLGAFLSGGIDSGLVVSYMSEALGRRVATTSVGFGEAGHNELDAAAHTAARFHTSHRAELVRPALETVFDQVVGAFDEPFADSSAIPTYYLSALARRDVTVALSGDGGDELFGGYGFRYVPHALESWARAVLPGETLAPALSWVGARWPRWRRLPRPFRLGAALENLGRDPAAAYYADLCFLKPAETRLLLGLDSGGDPRDSPVYDAVTAPYRRCPSPSAVQRAQYADLKVYLANDVLVKVDRMSMAHGLEVRCPLLDRRIVELAFRIPTATKMPRLQPKHLLRVIARRRLPPELLSLPKHGFTAPIGEWLRGAQQHRFRADVLSRKSTVGALLDIARVRSVFEAHVARRTDASYALWAVWVLERWKRLQRVTACSEARPPALPTLTIPAASHYRETAP